MPYSSIRMFQTSGNTLCHGLFFHASTISELSWMILRFSGIQNRHGYSLPLSIWHNSDIGVEWKNDPQLKVTWRFLKINGGSPILQVRPFHGILKLETPGDLWIPMDPPKSSTTSALAMPWPPFVAFLPPFRWGQRWAAQVTPLQASAAQGTGHVAWQRGQGPFGRMFVHGLWPMVLLQFKGMTWGWP